jgi:shikimate kinase
MNLFLIGYRCTGKTTVGEALAQRLDWSFADTDRMVIAAVGDSIARIVEDHGWAYFREQEHQVLETIAAGNHQVVATGGGIVLDARNITTMKKTGRIVWLRAGETVIHTRLLKDDTTAENRPALTRQRLLAEINTELSKRRPLYETAADYHVSTDRDDVLAICDRIIALVALTADSR